MSLILGPIELLDSRERKTSLYCLLDVFRFFQRVTQRRVCAREFSVLLDRQLIVWHANERAHFFVGTVYALTHGTSRPNSYIFYLPAILIRVSEFQSVDISIARAFLY